MLHHWKAEIETQDLRGTTPLVAAFRNGHVDVSTLAAFRNGHVDVQSCPDNLQPIICLPIFRRNGWNKVGIDFNEKVEISTSKYDTVCNRSILGPRPCFRKYEFFIPFSYIFVQLQL